MTSLQTVQSHPASVDAYIRQGWSLVPIPFGTKGPRSTGWNLKENALKSQSDLPLGYGIGLAHAYSGTMALDIDNWVIASTVLADYGIDLQLLYDAPDAVVINSGKPGHGKLLYAMPFGAVLPSKKVMHNNITVYELRCATASGLTVQDVLPPSIHPETQQSYTWAGKGHWTRLPIIPQMLLDLWNGMLEQDKQRTIATAGTVDASWEEIRQALEHISPDCSYDDWVNIGMALHWAGSQTDQLDQALALYNDWSATAQTKYAGEKNILMKWGSFSTAKSTAIKLGTLFHIARQNGWTRPMPDVSDLFGKVENKSPHDVIEGLRPKRPEMNMAIWPSVLSTRAEEVAESVGCDPLVPLYAGLAAVCGVIDARMRLELMPGFKVPPVLWLMTVGDPADKKSPGSRPMLSPLRDIEAEDRPRYGKELLDWEGKEAAYASAKKSFLEWSASPDALMGADQAPPVPDMPPQPVPLKITISDITSQKLVRTAADRPRGLLCHLDEMNSWVRKLTDKTTGEDRSAWVVSYESEHYEMDRVGAGSIHAENLAVAIYGNIQPQVLKANFSSLSADGLLQRFIPALLRPRKTKLGQPIPEYLTSGEVWSNTLRLIYALPPQTYRLSPDAFDVYRAFQSWYEQAKQDERLLSAGVEYMTAFGKLEGLTGRMCLIWHVIESPFSPTISADLMHRVIDLVRGYIIPAYRWMYGELCEDDNFTNWVIEHIVQNSADLRTVDFRSIRRSARRVFEKMPLLTEHQKMQMVLDSMSVLESSGWAIKTEEELHKQRIVWAINPNLPALFKEYREDVIRAKQRHADYIYRYAYDKGYKRKLVKGYDPDTMD
jgi:hypothetical protein